MVAGAWWNGIWSSTGSAPLSCPCQKVNGLFYVALLDGRCFELWEPATVRISGGGKSLDKLQSVKMVICYHIAKNAIYAVYTPFLTQRKSNPPPRT
jgi:hypothetical protein